MKSLALYGSNPFDLIDQMFSGDDFLYPQFRTPIVDVRDEEDRYVVEAELPGLSEKDVKLELKDGTLSLSTAKSETKSEKNDKDHWLVKERRQFQFSRSFSLPEDVNVENIEAKFRDGLLTIALPKKAESAPRIVPVKAA
jgi:HSP20 family protein